MERYSEYKDSGVQWLGEIPRHWKIMRSKYLLKIQSNCTKRNCKIGLENIEGFTGKFIKTSSVFEGDGIDFDKGDIVYGKLRPYLCKVWLAEFDGNAVGDFYVYKTSSLYFNTYAKYLMLSNSFTDICNASTYGAKMPRVSHQFISSLNIPLPPLSEQHSIVSYLDDKCAKIDKMLEGKQKQIELLAEMKQRIIADAVTRGLNPNVKMKTTNIPWLPEIPEHWEVKRSKNLFNKEQRPIEEGDDIVTCFRDGEVTLRKNRRTTGFTEATDYSHYQHICKGDLVIHQMDAFAGASGVSDSDGMGTPVLSVCTAKIEGLNHYYYAYILRLMGKNNFILSLYRGIRERSSDFRFETFAKQYLPVPPVAEQNDIVAYINERSIKIDTLTSKLQQEIESIKEYKQRLISDVVTGQIKVC